MLENIQKLNEEKYNYFSGLCNPIAKTLFPRDRLNIIIKKGFSKEMYWNSYIISDNHNLLFISLPKENYNIEFIDFISNVFMYNFKLNKVLLVIQ